MRSARHAFSARMLLAFAASHTIAVAETVRLYFDAASPQIAFAAGDIKAALEKQKHTVETHGLGAMYGGLDFVEAIRTGTFDSLKNTDQQPHIAQRGIKFTCAAAIEASAISTTANSLP